jgi:hypothetical protein
MRLDPRLPGVKTSADGVAPGPSNDDRHTRARYGLCIRQLERYATPRLRWHFGGARVSFGAVNVLITDRAGAADSATRSC